MQKQDKCLSHADKRMMEFESPSIIAAMEAFQILKQLNALFQWCQPLYRKLVELVKYRRSKISV